MAKDNSELAQARGLSGINFILGVWLIISPYILGYSSSASRWDQTIFGVIVLILSAIRYVEPRAAWASWLNGLSGLWLVIAPWILSYSRSVSYWNEVIVGVIVAILAFWNISTYSQPHHAR